MIYGDDPEQEYSGPPAELDDWDAQDWENFWPEPEETTNAGEEEADSESWNELDGVPDLRDPLSSRTAAKSSGTLAPTIEKSPAGPTVLQVARDLERKFFEAPAAWKAAKAAAAYRRARRPDLAIRFVLQAHTILIGKASVGNRAAMLTTVGASLADLGRYTSASACAKRAITLAPTQGQPWLVVGRAAAKMGRHAEADHYFEEGRRLTALAKK